MVDGHRVEAVHMPRGEGDLRVTYCISSQVGCALGCTFCATGAMGIVRNLTAGEIVGQVLVLMRELGPRQGESVFLVFMGMGEPLHNLAHVHRAITVLCHPQGAILSPWRITVSTAGLVSGIEKLARMTPRPQLALSLNATTDAARSATMPVNRAWNLARLRQALDAWVLKPHERLLFEYVMLAGVNDTLEDADRLVAWLGDLAPRPQRQPDPDERARPVRLPRAGRGAGPGLRRAPPRARLLRHRPPQPRARRAGRLRPAGAAAAGGRGGRLRRVYRCGEYRQTFLILPFWTS